MASDSNILMSRPNLTRCEHKSSDNRRAGNVDCPIFKHKVMNGEQVPCSGCAVLQMSQVRRHLSHPRHNGFPLFVKHCRRCKTTVVDRPSWLNGLHEAGTCEYKPAPRESIVTAWARLYLILYPSATRVPNPYTDERSWLPDAIVSFIRSPYTKSCTNENNGIYHRSIPEFLNTQDVHTLATSVDNFMPSPAHSESNGNNTSDSPSMPVSREIIDLISAGDDSSRAIEKVQDYLQSQLGIMPVQVYAAVDSYLGDHCGVEGDERDSAYGSMDAKSIRSHPQDADDGRNMAEIDPWSHYNTRLDHAGEGVMLTPEEVQARRFLTQPTESPSPLSLQPLETLTLETTIHKSPLEIKTGYWGNSRVQSNPPLKQARGGLVPLIEAYMSATQAKWDHATYASLWLNFIRRWDHIIEELGKQGSTTTRDAFAQVLQSIRARLQLDSNDLPSFANQQGHCTTHGNQTDKTASSKKRARHEESSSAAGNGIKRLKAASGLEEDSANRLLVDQDDPPDEFEFPSFRCPVQMYCLKYNLPPICEGWAGNHLSQLRHRHLKPPRTNGHDGLIELFERCKTCKEFVLNSDLWDRHQRGDCNWQDRPKRRRRAKEIDTEDEDVLLPVWARIYLTLFPHEQDVPNPYVGQTGDISRHLTERFRQQVNTTLPPLEAASFLDRQYDETVIPNLQNITLDDINHAAADVMLNDFLNPSALTLHPVDLGPMLDVGSTSYGPDLGPLAASSSTMANPLDFEARLNQASDATIDTLEEASTCLNPTAWRILVARAEAQLLARIETLRNTRRPDGLLLVESTTMFPTLHGSNLPPSNFHEQATASESSTLLTTQATSTQGPSTNLTSLDDTERTAPKTPPPQTAALTGSSPYPLQDMGAMDKELDQLATRDTRYAATSLPDAYSDMDSDFDFDSASTLRGHEYMKQM